MPKPLTAPPTLPPLKTREDVEEFFRVLLDYLDRLRQDIGRLLP